MQKGTLDQEQRDFRRSVAQNALWAMTPPIIIVLFAVFVSLALACGYLKDLLLTPKR